MMILAYGIGGRCILLKSECGAWESRQAHSSSKDDRHATPPKTLAIVKMTCVSSHCLEDILTNISSVTGRGAVNQRNI